MIGISMSDDACGAAPKILSGHQPDFLPWLGVFYKIRNSDVLKITDYAQYTKSWTNRVRIKNENGRPDWISIPISAADHQKPIREVKLATGADWKTRLLGKVQASYHRAARYAEVAEILETIRAYDGESLMDLNLRLLNLVLKRLDIATPVVMGSTLDVQPGKTMHIVDSCLKLGCSIYLAGQGADYLEESLFAERGIRLRRSRFAHPVYPQAGGEFVPGLSVLDAVAHLGWAGTSRLLVCEKEIYE